MHKYPFPMFSQTTVSFCDCSLIQAIIFVCFSSSSIFLLLTGLQPELLIHQLFQDPKEIFLRGFSRHWEEFKLLEKFWCYLPIKFSFPQQLYTGFTVLLFLLPPLPSVKLWHLCHQTRWAWGPSRQAFRPLSRLHRFCIQMWNFSVAHIPVLLSRPLSRTQRILACAHLPQVVLHFYWLSDEQFSLKSHCSLASFPVGTYGCFWNKLLVSETREITFFSVSSIPKSVIFHSLLQRISMFFMLSLILGWTLGSELVLSLSALEWRAHTTSVQPVPHCGSCVG